MKNLKIVIVFMFVTLTNIAQTDCKNNVSTNVNNPTNTSLPVIMDVNGNITSTNGKYLNGFDWLPANGSIYLQYNLFNTTTKNIKK